MRPMQLIWRIAPGAEPSRRAAQKQFFFAPV